MVLEPEYIVSEPEDMVSEPEDMVVMRLYCHLLGLGVLSIPIFHIPSPRSRSQVPNPRSQVPSPKSQSQLLDKKTM